MRRTIGILVILCLVGFGWLPTIDEASAGDSGASSFDASQYPKKKPTYWLIADCACGGAWKEQGNLERALADCDAVIGLDSGFAAAYANRGQLRRIKGDLDHAVADYQQAIRLSPETIPLYVLRGDLLRYKGELKQALAEYDSALRLDPDYVPALTGRALTYEKMGNPVQARLDFRKALDSPSKWAVQDSAKSARETANAQLAALRLRHTSADHPRGCRQHGEREIDPDARHFDRELSGKGAGDPGSPRGSGHRQFGATRTCRRWPIPSTTQRPLRPRCARSDSRRSSW